MKKIKLISVCFTASLFLWSCTASNSNISNEALKVNSSLSNQKKAIYEVSRGNRPVKTLETAESDKLTVVNTLKDEKPKVTIAKIEESKVKELKAEKQKVEVPKAETPKAEIPIAVSKIEEPKTEVPKSELPKTEDSIVEQPRTEAVKVQEAARPVEKPDDLEETIKITGSNSFIKQVQEALNLLKEKDLAAYKKVNKYLSKIVENENSGVDVYSKTFYIGKGTVSAADAFWLAGVIVHDAYHSELFSLNMPFTGAEAEKACNQQQKAALRNIGAPENYLTYLDEVSASQYWEVPFEQRGW